jgi:hypothetical protein
VVRGKAKAAEILDLPSPQIDAKHIETELISSFSTDRFPFARTRRRFSPSN